MTCGTSASAASAESIRLSLGEQLVLIHFNSVLTCKVLNYLQICVLVRLQERYLQAEALGKGSQLLTGISCMDIVTVTVGKAFLDKVAAVAGGVDDSI